MVVFENKNIESELIIKDTKANPSLAQKATKELVDQNVDVILGPFFSESLNKSGKRVLNTYRNVIYENKLSLNKVELYDSNSNDLEKNIQNLVGLQENPQIEIDEETGDNPIENFDPGFDVLLLIETGNKLREAVALLTYYGVDFKKVKLIGTGEWYEENIGSKEWLTNN